MAERKEWWEILRDQFASRGLLDPESERIQEATQALPSVQRQARGLLSLNPQAESDAVLEMGLGSLPGVGQAMALRDLERARRDRDPVAGALAASNFIPFGSILSRMRRGGDDGQVAMAADGSSFPTEMQPPKDEQYFNLEGLTTQPSRKVEIPRYEPPRGAPGYMQRLAKNQKAYDQILNWARRGMTEEGLGWYNTDALRDEFVKEFGEDVGQKNYEKYIDLVAATSAGAKTPANAKIASYYYQQAVRGEPAVKPPKGSGYGHKAQNLHFKNAAEILAGGQLDPIKNPKRFTFGENLKGNWDYATVDKHNVRAFAIASKDPEFINSRLADPKGTPKPSWWNEKKHGAWDAQSFNPREFVQTNKVKWETIPPTWFKEAPSKTDYKAFEELNKRLAKDLGVSPAAAQAALWLGAGEVTGLGSPPIAFMKVLEERLAATAKKRGITREKALKDFIQGKAPLAKNKQQQVQDGLLSQQDQGSMYA